MTQNKYYPAGHWKHLCSSTSFFSEIYSRGKTNYFKERHHGGGTKTLVDGNYVTHHGDWHCEWAGGVYGKVQNNYWIMDLEQITTIDSIAIYPAFNHDTCK